MPAKITKAYNESLSFFNYDKNNTPFYKKNTLHKLLLV